MAGKFCLQGAFYDLDNITGMRSRFGYCFCYYKFPGNKSCIHQSCEKFTNRITSLKKYMIRNFFKIALTNLLKRKVYTLINILGLATGMAVCLLIILFIQDELSFDKFHEKGDQVYRMVLERKYPG